MRAVCVEGADEERETDREADGDDKREAGCAKAEYPGGHRAESRITSRLRQAKWWDC